MRVIIAVLYFTMINEICAQDIGNELESAFSQTIEEENSAINNTPEFQYEKLANLHLSRGESYLVVGKNKKAFDDFQKAYQYAQNCSDPEEIVPLTFRSVLGAFLISVRMENLDAAQTFGSVLQNIIKNYSCEECHEKTSIKSQHSLSDLTNLRTMIRLASNDQPDQRILGPDQISVQDCLERVGTTEHAIYMLIAVVKKTEVRAIAIAVVDALADRAASCCRAGGLWKGCLQKLINKLHYWKMLGIPADPAWD